ncbi:Ig-like domain-containing protein [Bdellovibrio reynosensis]|uniref:Ig-like domain-containing protein n=1 Tax=Bdellovibrio reynosensis TaxID=2835041 RepID=A0ABY4CC01_9BACT|nr:Ig-like domain-containing protein [Bdellovibrio reynosensis]UOF02472.1 Ig-like domain-containing protein [Bdellovibrio reynosensis]
MLARTFLITSLLVLVGCMNGGFETLSSALKLKTTLKAAYKTTDVIALQWQVAKGDQAPEYLQLEVSTDDGKTWTVHQENIEPTGLYDWDLSPLLPGTYKVALVTFIKGTSERFILGSIFIDNQVPVVGADQSISVTEDTVKTFDINLPVENDQYTLSIVSAPTKGSLTGCTDGGSTLQCVYTTSADNDLDDQFTYKIVDRAGYESAIGTVNFDLQPLNDVPVITTLACAASAGENVLYSCTISATDVDLPSPLTLSYQLDPATTCGPWLTIDSSTGVVSGTPAGSDVGTSCTVEVYAEDDVSGQSQHFAWSLAIENSPPIIILTGGPYSINEDAGLATVIPAGNISSIEEGGASTYSLSTPSVSGDLCEDHTAAPLATNLSIDSSTGAVSFRPQANYQGTCYIRVNLTDSFPSTGYLDVPIQVNNQQDAPAVATNLTPCAAAITEDVPYTCTVTITDPDPEVLTLSRHASDTCGWISETYGADNRTVTFSGTPNDSDVGVCILALEAADPLAANHMQSLSITVNNAEPTLTIAAPTTLVEDVETMPATVLTDVQVVSLDETHGTYSLDFTGLTGTACNDAAVIAVPSDFSINSTTGAVTFLPRADYFGTCYANIQFDDGNGAGNSIDTKEVTFVVDPVNDAPQITAIPTSHEILLNPSGATTSSFNLTIDVGPANENSQSLQLICTNSNTSRLTVDCTQNRNGDGVLTVNLSAIAGLDTSAIVTVKVKDSAAGTDESTVATIHVSVTDAVVLSAIAASTNNYNIYDQAVAQYSTGVATSTRTFVVTVNPGVTVSSADPSLPAMRTGSLVAGARVRLINKGSIIGAAGAGGSSAFAATGAQRMGQHGGTAFKIEALYAQVDILNDGFIFGGGGGGGRGGTDNTDAGAGGAGGRGEDAVANVNGTAGALAGGSGGNKATSLIYGTTPAADYAPSNGIGPTDGMAGQGGSSCLIGTALGNSAGEAYFGRGGFGAGFGGGAGACSVTYGGGGGGGYYGGGGGSGGLADNQDAGNVNTDTNGYNGGHGGAAIEVPTSVNSPSDINIDITPGATSKIAGCVWNDFSGVYLVSVTSDSDVNNRALTFSSTTSLDVSAPPGIKFWNNGRGKAYR